MLVEEDHEPSNSELYRILDDFLKTSPCSLLIRGEPGQGKTTFVLTLMKRYKDSYRGYYVSTRVSLEKLEMQFSWIRGLLSKESVLEAENSAKQDLKGFDARIGRARNLTEIVTNAALGDSALVVLDSWDTLAKETPFDERAKTERMITTIADAHNSLIIFVGEEDEYSRNSAYLVDGIITLSYYTVDSVKIRKLTIDKMRGTSIPRMDLLYTLDDSRFEILPKLRSPEYPSPARYEPVKLKPGFFSSGNIHLDTLLGGVREGSVILIESDQGTMKTASDLMLSCFVLNALGSKNSAIMVNAADTPAKETARMVKPFVTAEAAKNFRVFAHGGSDIGDASVIGLGDDEAANHDLLQKEYLSLRSSSRGGGQVVLGLDVGLSQKESAEAAKIWSAKLVDLCRTVRNNGDLLVMVNRTGLDTIPLCKTVSDIHMQITNKSGVHFMRVQKPAIEGPTILFSVSAGEKKYPSYVLKKVV
jgi:KaiC/GvpD/RAD55 family RecA-like ATPase